MTTHATIPTHAAMRRTVREIHLAWTYRAAYRTLLATRTPAGAE